MEYELTLKLNGNTKKVKVAPGLYLDRAVYQITIDGRSLVIFKNPANKWSSDTDHHIDQDQLQLIGEAIDANL